MLVSIIIPSYMNEGYLKLCVEHIKKFTKGIDYELIIVDNNSDFETKQYLKSIEDESFIKVIYNSENEGYVKACNLGIKISKGDVVVLLNNDVFVTPNWLLNLLKCLFHRDDVGAVSPVTNNSPYYQTIDVQFSDLEEMVKFAEKFNFSDETKWEERLKLIGYCLVIKKSVVEKVGLLDERFSPGNYEDDDYSIRMIKAGYKLFLCKDTFVYHVGGASFNKIKDYANILNRNKKLFVEKWGFNPDLDLGINKNILNIFDSLNKKKLKVLEIGCGCGANLLYLKNNFSAISVYGLEKKITALEIANKVLDVWYLDDDFNVFCKIKDKFDVIILINILEKFDNYKELLINIRSMLVDGGSLVITFENRILKEIPDIIFKLTKISNENDLKFYCNKILNLFLGKIYELKTFLEDNFFEVVLNYIKVTPNKVLDELCDLINNKINKNLAEIFKIQEFVLVAKYDRKKLSLEEDLKKLKFILRRLEFGIDKDRTINELTELIFDKNLRLNVEQIIKVVYKSIVKKDQVLNDVAVILLEKGCIDDALRLFEESYRLNPQNRDTSYNLAYLLYQFGNLEQAYKVLSNLREKDGQINWLIQEIVSVIRRNEIE